MWLVKPSMGMVLEGSLMKSYILNVSHQVLYFDVTWLVGHLLTKLSSEKVDIAQKVDLS